MKTLEIRPENAWSAGTVRVYDGRWKDFCAFCSTRGLPSLPTDEATIQAYLTALVNEGRSASTVSIAVEAIERAHQLAGLDSVKTPRVRLLHRAARRASAAPPKGARPVELAELQRMVDAIDLSEPVGRRDAALLLLQFTAGARISEIVGLRISDVTKTKAGLELFFRRSKTDQEAQGRHVVIPRQPDARYCAARAVEERIADVRRLACTVVRRGSLKPVSTDEAPVFGSLENWWRPLTTRSAQFIVMERGEAVGAYGLSTHSLRAGFVTTALDRGADPFEIARITGHKQLDTLRKYDRRSRWVAPANEGLMTLEDA